MSLVRLCRRALLSLTVLSAVLFSLYAQSDLGTINGTVKDQSGAVIPNATVVVRNEATGTERRTTSNESGSYTVSNIPSGVYTVSVTATGFKKFDTSGNKLDPSSTLAVDAALTVGQATETVEVSATAQQLQTESASVQRDVTREQIDALELNGRNPIFMANLVPGTRGGNLSSLSFNFSQGPSNINGARTPESLITYDGAPAVRTRSNGTSLGAADVDSTQEIQILTADYAAEYGRSSGGQIRILTRSGGQQFHGAAYEYVRNTVFNANTWSRNQNPATNFVAPINYNQYGFNIGGPFYIPGKFNTDKSKFFWYWGTEWVRYRYTDSSSLTVPSLLMRQGNFSELLSPSNYFYGKTITIKDPTTGAPYPNNVIPQSALSPSGLGILKAYPAPNLPTPIGSTNWIGYAIHPQNQRKDTLAVDMNLTDKQRLQFRRMNYAFNEYQPLDGGTPYTPKFFNRPNQTNSLDWVWTISPTLVHESLATVSLDDVYIPVDTAHFLNRTSVGINYPYIFPSGKLIPTRIPTVNFSSVISGLSGGPYPSHSSGPIYTYSDSLTWIKGTHTFKFGFYFERSGENDNDEINVSACPTCTNNQNGQFGFSDTRGGNPTSGNSIANAALGLFDTYSELGQRAFTIFRGSMYEGFAQDSWKVTNKLHVDIGLRYTVNVPYSALWRNMIVFDPKFYDPSKAVAVDPKTGLITIGNGDRYNGMVIPGNGWPSSANGRFPEAGNSSLNYLFRNGAEPSYYSDIHWGNLGPRLGVAYQLNDKTVIRAGGGRFFTRLGVSDSVFLGGNPPFQPTANVSYGNVDNPGGTSTNVLPLTVTTQSKNFKMPEAWNWNVTVQRQLPWQLVASAAYVGRLGLHLQRESDINHPTLATVLANPGVNIDALRPYLGYNSIRETDNVARSRYDSGQFTLNKRLTQGFLFGVSYTLSNSYDNGSNQRDIIPYTYNANNLWGPSEFDVRHIVVINYLYNLPFFKNNNLTGRLLGGWQISGITQWQTGTPCSVGTGNDYAGIGLDGSLCGIGQYWVLNGAAPTIVGQFAAGGANDPRQYFTTTTSGGAPLFSAPAKGTINLQPGIRDLIHGPGFNNWNMGLFKTFAIKERLSMQFRAEAFDIWNHPNWNGPNFNPTASTFGKVTSKTNDVRNMQLSLRLQF
ncbi:MAG: carboxypeptidase regulatory-like domain-containing protein [Acidobacteriaceae bacterium]|nr:carboxypeptidase regulatory-like domain-containing protein [Acidobacteriaceae bacterium]